MRSPERALQIIGQLHSELEGVLADAIQIALRQSLAAAAMVRELEIMGYHVTTDFNYIVTARPLEAVFEQSLTENDRRFLLELNKNIPSPEGRGDGDTLSND